MFPSINDVWGTVLWGFILFSLSFKVVSQQSNLVCCFFQYGELVQLEAKIKSKITGADGGTDVGYWESLLQQLNAHMARVIWRINLNFLTTTACMHISNDSTYCKPSARMRSEGYGSCPPVSVSVCHSVTLSVCLLPRFLRLRATR